MTAFANRAEAPFGPESDPISDAAWREIDLLGHAVDARLAAGDVRLTMGGEPTFVAAADVDAPEWQTAAIGPSKQRYADDLARRLRRRFAPGGLLHHGDGKWYPGEDRPRWAFAVCWRRDGAPLWHDVSLIGTQVPEAPACVADAESFARRLSETLGLDPDYVVPAYEDPVHALTEEQKLPLNLDLHATDLAGDAARKRLAAMLDRGLGRPAAFLLPLMATHRRGGGRRWCAESWRFRRGKLFLVPGDAPAGHRIPFRALPELGPGDFPLVMPVDPMAVGEEMPEREALLREHGGEGAPAEDGPVRTALLVEPRDGHLWIFLPPLQDADAFAALVAAVETTAAALRRPVRLEGCTPPPDPRLTVLTVTPDPGVIEVNLQPAGSWDALQEITRGVYEEARLAGLATCKLTPNGRRIATGGGNHVVVGGATPADSPFLRRPDLLASAVAYWQNHPSLSYLFSGLFIGPTCQAPRVDEARHESLYELEIAMAQVSGADGTRAAPWLVDRIFRNLLVDVTGNTHRAEICIDKLYSPEGTAGRLGLVEFRAFEMAPHPRMALVQQLLVRAIIVRLWERPFEGPLVRWGTALHDRFMLPHLLWQDFRHVLDDLASAGFAFDEAWFRPQLAFRFPELGRVRLGAVELVLGEALEPWNVIGEDAASGGVARTVDSSLQRLELRAAGLEPGRHAVTCNGHVLPLTPADDGVSVAGVRFRASAPPERRHPTIGVHAPLSFDLVDLRAGRALGGFRYHAARPDGSAYDDLPADAQAAEARRRERFEPVAAAPEPVRPAPPRPNPDYPHTLDLRRV